MGLSIDLNRFEDHEDLTLLAKIAQQTERHDEIAACMKKAAKLSVAYKNVVGSRRSPMNAAKQLLGASIYSEMGRQSETRSVGLMEPHNGAPTQRPKKPQRPSAAHAQRNALSWKLGFRLVGTARDALSSQLGSHPQRHNVNNRRADEFFPASPPAGPSAGAGAGMEDGCARLPRVPCLSSRCGRRSLTYAVDFAREGQSKFHALTGLLLTKLGFTFYDLMLRNSFQLFNLNRGVLTYRTRSRQNVWSKSIALYHEKVIDHYENPRNVGSLDKNDAKVGTGLVGAPACGDVMRLQIKVDDDGKIVGVKFKTFGCGSAIASSSLATEWIKGRTVDDAGTIKNTDIAKELSLPPVKLHCSSKSTTIVY